MDDIIGLVKLLLIAFPILLALTGILWIRVGELENEVAKIKKELENLKGEE